MNKKKPKIKIVFKRSKNTSKEEVQRKIDKAFDILFEEIIKDKIR